MKKRILIVEDDAALAQVVCDILTFEGFEVELVSDGTVAIDRAREFVPDLVLLDLMLPGRNGFDLCEVIRRGGALPLPRIHAAASGHSELHRLRQNR